MSFQLDASTLERLSRINHFKIPTGGLVFFGLRGCLPTDLDGCTSLRKRHSVQTETADYVRPRCTLGQWLPAEEKLALFPGSTVPHRKHVSNAKAKGGRGANQLATGLYVDYRKGVHKAETPTAHAAFRQTAGRPVQRTSDDLDFDADDRIEVENPFDNLHAAWSMGPHQEGFASAGCQVVVGFPKCTHLGPDCSDTGAWATFRGYAYDEHGEQGSYPYMLLNGRDALTVAEAERRKLTSRLRFGSSGPLVTQLQNALAERQFYEGRVDEDFGDRTLRALLGFQAARFGRDGADGIAGPNTATLLGLELPMV